MTLAWEAGTWLGCHYNLLWYLVTHMPRGTFAPQWSDFHPKKDCASCIGSTFTAESTYCASACKDQSDSNMLEMVSVQDFIPRGTNPLPEVGNIAEFPKPMEVLLGGGQGNSGLVPCSQTWLRLPLSVEPRPLENNHVSLGSDKEQVFSICVAHNTIYSRCVWGEQVER